ncbi:hypothetical protein ACQKND_04740 [Viridibacillus arvi]|uniref:hypothetical protein n=1 Tax=Viridibacillus arvi TaxID=263475 RepID=UPI003CFDEBE8
MFLSILVFLTIVWRFWYIYQPRTGPLGEKLIPELSSPVFWTGIIGSFLVSAYAFSHAIELFKRGK